MSFSKYLRRLRRRGPLARTARRHWQRSVRLRGEGLEDRSLLSISGIPLWTAEGPAPIGSTAPAPNGGSVTQVVSPTAPKNPVDGGINAVLVDPANDHRLFVGSQYGGVWETNDATDATPFWSPLTDQLPNLQVSAMAFGYANTNVLYAGLDGRPFGRPSGPAETGGLLVSTNGGSNWALLDQSTFAGLAIGAVATGPNNVVLAATGNAYGNGGHSNAQPGLYRSTNGAASFGSAVQLTTSSGAVLTNVQVTDVIADPGDPGRFYAAVAGQGIFRSTNDGSTWTQIAGATSGLIRLAIPDVASNANNPLFVGVNNPSSQSAFGVVSVSYSTNAGSATPSFGPMTATPSLVKGRFSIEADPTNSSLVYLVGTGGGGWLGNAGVSSNQWQSIVGSGANGTSPHVDSRNMAFDADGNLLELDDGGLYRLVSPRSSSRQWQAVDGNIQATQFYSVAYDSLSHVITGGAQDNASSIQTSEGDLLWQQTNSGDGQVTQVDNQTDANLSPGYALVYTTNQGFGDLQIQAVNDEDNAIGAPVIPTLLLNGSTLNDPTAPFTTQYRLNAVTPTHMLIGTQYLYESQDQGNHLTQVTGSSGGSLQLNGAVTAMVYGNSSNANVAYVGTDNGSLYLRSVAGDQGTFQPLSSPLAGQKITGIALDPNNWQVAYVSGTSDVYFTTNAGATWNRITGNLGQQDSGLDSLELAKIGSDSVVLVGGQSGLYRVIDPPAQGPTGGSSIPWSKLDFNLPNAPVYDVHYNPQDDVLVVGTFGRGAWELANASTYLTTDWNLIITHNSVSASDTVRLVLDPYNSNLLDVFQINTSSTPNAVVPLASLGSVVVQGLNEPEDLIIDNSNGVVDVPHGILYYGGSVASPGGANYATLSVSDANESSPDSLTENGSAVTWSFNSATGSLTLNNVGAVDLDGGSGGSTFNALATSSGVTTDFSGGYYSSINVGNNGSVQGIQGTLNLENPPAFNTINVNDSNDATARTVSLENTASPFSGDTDPWGAIVGLAPAVINYEYFDTRSLTIDGGSGGGTMNVLQTGVTTTIAAGGFSFSRAAINVGSNGSVQGIQGTLNLENPFGLNTISLYDSNDTVARNTTISNLGTNPSDSQGNTDAWGHVVGLAPAAINYEYPDTSSLTIVGGSGGDTLNVLQTEVTTNFSGGHNSTINVGSNGSVQGIRGTLRGEN